MTRPFLFLLLLLLPLSSIAQWHELPGPDAGRAYDFAGVAGSNSRLYAATENGVDRSTDNGRSWRVMGLLRREVLKVLPFQNPSQEIVFAIVRDFDNWRLCRSKDSAKTWDTVLTSGLSMLEVFEDGSDILLCIGNTVDTAGGVYRSSDLGKTWSHQVPNASRLFFTDFAFGNGNIYGIVYNNGLWVVPSHGTIWQKTDYSHTAYSVRVVGQTLLVGGNGRIDISTDNGVSWLAVPNIELDSTKDPIYTFATSGLTFIASALSTYRSTDGARSWQNIQGTGGFPRSPGAWTINFINGQFIAGTDAGVVTSVDGITWSYSSGLIGGSYDIISNDTTLFAMTARGVFKSNDQGPTWIPPRNGSDLLDSLPAAFTTLPSGLYASGSAMLPSGLWRWNGTQWITITNLQNTGISEDSGNLYLALGRNGLVTSSDNGVSWHVPAFGLPVDTMLTDAVLAGGRTLAFVSSGYRTTERVYYSDDHGLTWQPLNSLPAHGPVHGVLRLKDGRIIVGCDSALCVSTDGGISWSATPENVRQIRPFANGAVVTTLDSIYVLTNKEKLLLVDSATGHLAAFTNDKQFAYAASNNRGIWATPLNSLPLSVPITPHTAMTARLEVYPNPATDKATISFDLPDREFISLRLYDERGVAQSTIFNGLAGPDTVSIPLTFENLADGVYFIHLSSSQISGMARIVIRSHE